MNDTFNLLIIEDDDSQIEIYQDAIDEYNRKAPDLKFQVIIEKSLENGLEVLKNSVFDGATIDLKLSSEDIRGEGNKIISEIRNKYRFPIVVLSGYPDDLQDELRMENSFFRVYPRSSIMYSQILDDFIKIYNTGVTRILGIRGVINNLLDDIFWNRLSNSIGYWIEQNIPENNTAKIISRYIVTHLSEYLDLDEQGKFENYHVSEIYISPPFRKFLFTGDIITNTGTSEDFIVLSPACDMAHEGKAECIVIAKIKELNMDKIKEYKSYLSSNKEKTKRRGEDGIKALVKNSGSLRYHFLPPSNGFKGGFIDFQQIYSEKNDSVVNIKYKIISSISSKFVKDIIARFSNYYARQGQPDINFDEMVEYIKNYNQ